MYITRLNKLSGSHSAIISIIGRCNENRLEKLYRPHTIGHTQGTLITLSSQVKYTRIVLVYITRLNKLSGSHSATILIISRFNKNRPQQTLSASYNWTHTSNLDSFVEPS
jgi:hypothetical protein